MDNETVLGLVVASNLHRSGKVTFLSELFASFWRGEFMWHASLIGFKGLDLFYVLSSVGLVVIAVISIARTRTKKPAQHSAACFGSQRPASS